MAPNSSLAETTGRPMPPLFLLVNCPLLLLLSNILNLKTQQVNDTQAFPYAPLNNPVYMRMHQGWHVTPA